MPVVKLDDDVPPDDGPDNDNNGGDALVEEELEEEPALDPDIDPEHPRGARWSERRAARKRIIFTDVNSGVVALDDGTLFDPAFYAATNPDVVADYGTDTDALLAHWLKIGKKQGRPPIAPRTPTPTPIWMMQPVDGGGDDDHSHEDHKSSKPSSTTGQTSNTIVLAQGSQTSGTVGPFGGQFGKGARANANYNANNNGWNITLTSPDSGNNPTVTIPAISGVDPITGNSRTYSVSLDSTDSYMANVSIDYNQPGMSNVNTVDLSSNSNTTGGNVNPEGMITFMNNNGPIDTLMGPGTTLTRNTTTTNNTYSAKAAAPSSQTRSNMVDIIDNRMGTGNNQITKLTFGAEDTNTPPNSYTFELTPTANQNKKDIVIKDGNNNPVATITDATLERRIVNNIYQWYLVDSNSNNIGEFDDSKGFIYY